MKDTPQVVQDLYRTLLMARSGAERLKMGCAMFDASRTLTIANLQAQSHTDEDLSVSLLIRTYGRDINRDVLARIAQQFSARHCRQS